MVKAISIILFWISIGKADSKSSFKLFFPMENASLTINILTIIPAMGSKITHVSPNNIAPPIPTAVQIEEKASDLWWWALAIIAGLLIFLPI